MDKRSGVVWFVRMRSEHISSNWVIAENLIQRFPTLGLLGLLSFAASAAAWVAVLLAILESWCVPRQGRSAINMLR